LIVPASGHHAIARDALLGHPELGGIVLDEGVDLLEAALVEQHVEALAGGQAALAMLGVDPALPAAHVRGRAAAFEFWKSAAHG
jgi:hypothetical protein